MPHPRLLAAAALLCLSAGAARAQGFVAPALIECSAPGASSGGITVRLPPAPCGVSDNPLFITGSVTSSGTVTAAQGAPGTQPWPVQTQQGALAPTAGTTTSANATTSYQLFGAGAITVGGAVINTSAPGTAPIYVDRTGATSTTACPPSKGALPVYPAASATTAPGSVPLLPSTKAVTWCGPVGTTVQADGG